MYYFDRFAGEAVEMLLSDTLKATATEFLGEVLDLLKQVLFIVWHGKSSWMWLLHHL